MAVFIELVTDAFEAVFRDQASSRQNAGEHRSSRAGRSIVRRPNRGIEIKEDTYAYLRVILANGSALPLLDSSSPDGENSSGYTNFILQSVQEERMEKHQIVETFGESYIFFFGESPRFLNITAQLINTNDFNWRAEWWHNYENYLRGTKLVELGARCYLFYDDNVVEGYILGAQAGEVAEQPYQVSLTFRFFITKYKNISLQNVQYFPLRASSNIIEDPELTNADAFTRAAVEYRETVLGIRATEALERNQAVLDNQLVELERAQKAQEVLEERVAADPDNDQLQAQLAQVTQSVRRIQNSLQSTSTISDRLRDNPFLSMDPDIWTKLVGVVGVVDPDNPNSPVSIQPRQRSPRGLIAENVDEYMMGMDGNHSPANELLRITRAQSTRRAAESALFEANDLTRQIVENLVLIGINANNAALVNALGLGPNFGPGFGCGPGGGSSGFGASAFASASAGVSGGANFSASASASATASFSPFSDIGSSAGGSARASFGAISSARAGSFANASVRSDSFSVFGSASFGSDPLFAVYGRSSGSVRFGSDRGKFVEGIGDLEYGYNSEFGGVGFGQAGYGDFGGNGFGGSSSRGDPGFRASAGFSFKGVTGAEAAFSKFTTPRGDNTALTGGCVLGGSSLNGRGSVHVGGSSSAFSLVSAEGSIEPWASAQASASGRLSFGASATANAFATAGIGL